MELASLGSGSKGNGTLIRAGDALVLVDCGFTLVESLRRLARLGVSGEQLTAVLVTHEHGDHVRGVASLARRFNLPVMTSSGTAVALAGSRNALEGCRLTCWSTGQWQHHRDLAILPVAVPHDAREPCQYVFVYGRRRLGVLTDLGMVNRTIREAYDDCDALLLECNHDLELLRQGAYPSFLKRRVGGPLGHLSNAQSAAFLQQLNTDRLQHLVLSHLSEQNNTPALAREAVAVAVGSGERVRVACQQQGFDWLSIE
jgi:phosphoribosyl 1,2-cyclic phosphodiesterase